MTTQYGQPLSEGMKQQLTDRDVMNSALTALKHLSHVYHGLSEHIGNPMFLQEVSALMNDKQSMRLRVFQEMNQRGWYNPQLIGNPQLQQHKQHMTQTFQQLQQQMSNTQSHAVQWQNATGPAQQRGFQGNQGLPHEAHQHSQEPWQTSYRQSHNI